MSRRLDDLSPRMLPLAERLLARCTEAGIQVAIVDTLRTPAEHAANLARGVSWTTRSKHLVGDAIDICPFAVWSSTGPDKLNWSPDDPVWNVLGEIGESIGLKWGGRWKVRDLGHFEFDDSRATGVSGRSA
jgi:peptidoglycan L-alanyl-D-glutamate endopeptidase CwlK